MFKLTQTYVENDINPTAVVIVVVFGYINSLVLFSQQHILIVKT